MLEANSLPQGFVKFLSTKFLLIFLNSLRFDHFHFLTTHRLGSVAVETHSRYKAL